MNNKFKELADKANAYTDVSGRWVSAAGMNKFAELIVKECSNFLKDTLDDHFAAEQLEEHFGVER